MQIHRTLSAVLTIASAALFVSLLFAFTGERLGASALTAPGGFLAGAFSYAAFYVPLYLLAAAYLLVRNGFRRRSVVVLTASILPFLSASLACKAAFETVPSGPAGALVDLFGRVGGTALFSLLTALLIVLIAGSRRGLSGNGATRSVERRDAEQEELVSPETSADAPSSVPGLRPILSS